MDTKGDISSINRDTWTRQRTLRWFEQFEGWSDAGEELAIADAAPSVRGTAILDIGVGAGRTVPLMLDLSSDYVAVDFTRPMVDACRRKYPDLRIEWADARDLGAFADESFGFVMFSWNGIDAIDHEGRGRALAEIHRVLRPGGTFLFSTLNERGPEARARPWTRTLNPRQGSRPERFARAAASFPIELLNFVRHRRDWVHGTGWSVRSLSSHHFGLVTHYTTLEHEIEELADAGFDVVTIRENLAGTVVGPRDDTKASSYFHFVTRKRP